MDEIFETTLSVRINSNLNNTERPTAVISIMAPASAYVLTGRTISRAMTLLPTEL